MRYFGKVILFLAALVIASCVSKKEKKNGEKYSTVVYYDDNFQYHDSDYYRRRTERLLSKDTLYIFFETEFKSDTVEIKINSEEVETLYLKTNPVLGLAGMAQFGGIQTIDKIEIIKNNGVPAIINLAEKSKNLWAVSFYMDTLRVQSRKYLSTYE